MSDPYKQFFKKAQDNRRVEKPEPAKTKSRPKARSEEQLRGAMRMKRPRAAVPWKAVIGLIASVGLSAGYILAPDEFHAFAERIEISAIGGASAADKAAEKSAPPAGKEAKASRDAAKGEVDKGAEASSASSADLSHYEKLKARKEELDLREKELVELEEELQRQKVELDKRIVQLEDMRNQIGQVLKERVEVDQEKVNKLVDLYSNMKPKQAADVIGTINEDLAVEILAKMKKKSAAEIMNLLPAEKARVLSEKYTGYRRGLEKS